ncbi:MAG: HD domain-containing protein, partial [Candidatus Omnitrophica bacterium]|nr:HD domain-containing protein [Candidatus Omnitrophota bacterium]MBU1926125.1 HD domain-containing protein [Candidatus Omnitrophota bacterium]
LITFIKIMSKWNYSIFYTTELYDIYGNSLFKNRNEIDDKLIENIIHLFTAPDSEIIISSTSLIDDIASIMKSASYKMIFSNEKNFEDIISILETIHIKNSIFEELQNIKEIMPSTYFHTLIVAALCLKMAQDFKSEDYNPDLIAGIGLVHDLGKSRIPLEILEKPTPLTETEFKVIQTHPLIEYILLSYYWRSQDSFIANTAFSHHERLDGSGYPRGIKTLNKYVQLLTICDIFDALISLRPYRNEPYSIRAALDLLLQEADKGKLNKQFVLCLLSYVRQDKPDFRNLKISAENRDTPPKINYYGVRAA